MTRSQQLSAPRRAGRSLAMGLVVLGVSAGVAQAVTPTPGEWWGETKPPGGNDSSALFRVEGDSIRPHRFTRKWQAIVAPTTFKCNQALLQLKVKRLRIEQDRFAYHGRVVDAAGNKPTGITGRLDWTGRFTSPTEVRGTVRLRTKITPVFDRKTYKYKHKKKRCDTGRLKWSGSPVDGAR